LLEQGGGFAAWRASFDLVEEEAQRALGIADEGEVDGWDEGPIAWDVTEDGRDRIYCIVCDHEFPRPEKS
jgi:hypothetical protein